MRRRYSSPKVKCEGEKTLKSWRGIGSGSVMTGATTPRSATPAQQSTMLAIRHGFVQEAGPWMSRHRFWRCTRLGCDWLIRPATVWGGEIYFSAPSWILKSVTLLLPLLQARRSSVDMKEELYTRTRLQISMEPNRRASPRPYQYHASMNLKYGVHINTPPICTGAYRPVYLSYLSNQGVLL